jgi:branched-chain amino acid transport system permease protein
MLDKFFPDYGTWYRMRLSLLVGVVAIKFPRRLWGFPPHRFDPHFFPAQRQQVLHSLDKDHHHG